jgi:hypothetical protein
MNAVLSLRRWAAALGLACTLPLPAQAVLVTGEWDPPFGAFLPNLAYRYEGSFQVPLACTNLPDGLYATSLPACAGASVVFLQVTLSNIVGGLNPTGFSIFYDIDFGGLASVRIEGGAVVGFTVNNTALLGTNAGPVSFPDAAEGNTFAVGLDPTGPIFICLQCVPTLASPPDPMAPNVDASRAGLQQFLVTYTSDDNSTPKFQDGNGAALGTRLDEQGRVIGQATSISAPLINAVPEPGALALTLTALGMMGLMGGVRTRARRTGAG